MEQRQHVQINFRRIPAHHFCYCWQLRIVQFEDVGQCERSQHIAYAPEWRAEIDVEDAQALGASGLDEPANGFTRGWAALCERAEADGVGTGRELREFVGPGEIVPGGVLGDFEGWLAGIV